MLKLLADFVDHPVTRVVAALMGLLAIAFLGLFGVLVTLSPKTSWMLAVGAGGLVGLVGWGLRVGLNLPALVAHPLLRWTVCGSLAVGIAAITYTAFSWPDAAAWRQFLWPIGLMGLLLFVGTLASWQKPDHSFKPDPVRKSA
mgnify:CR=1 FL=1